jgi:hypothetical protein
MQAGCLHYVLSNGRQLQFNSLPAIPTTNFVMNEPSRSDNISRPYQISLFLIACVMTITLWSMGRIWWCDAGDYVPWSWDVWSTHNSQHLVDPYALSHLQHGLGLFLLLYTIPWKWLTAERIFVIVALIEATWEISENTPWMINRYRESTISLDYYGDSILNSIADYGWCLVGLLIARKLPGWATLCLFVTLELVSVLWIRDSLMLNILMLISPVDAIKEWQAAGQPAVAWIHGVDFARNPIRCW